MISGMEELELTELEIAGMGIVCGLEAGLEDEPAVECFFFFF